jgi:hypothetical protein
VGGAPAPSLESLLAPRSWQGIEYRPLDPGQADARKLFDYAAVWIPSAAGEVGWGAWDNDRLTGAILLEPAGSSGMIYGPLVVETGDPIETASHLLSALLPHAQALGLETLFTRPQGLDRVWIRFGFIPVPEADLPKALKGRPGVGLFGWRGGRAVWSSRKPAGDE